LTNENTGVKIHAFKGLEMLPIARPPWNGLGAELESACRKAIYDFSLLENVEKVSIALSGGKDSLTLLYLLHAIRGHGFPLFDLFAIHVHGSFSCGAGVDDGFLKGICDELNVPLIVKTSTKKLEDLECYSCSRERRKLIFEAAKEVGATTIAFGHHRDDSAQTLLLNLLQKAEFAANLPKIFMKHYGITIVRPLIYISEESLKTFAKQHGFLRISCQCPVGQDSQRKKADRLIKEMQDVFPHARSNLARAGLLYGSHKASKP
jgi:tRNA 2-thiocytidine biosynthesis protein TtcA